MMADPVNSKDWSTPCSHHWSLRNWRDVIVANDVVEHVQRLETFLENIRGWLTARGVAYFEIPNGACAAFVLRDGHHQLFGITLLDFDQVTRRHLETYLVELIKAGGKRMRGFETAEITRITFLGIKAPLGRHE